MPSPNPAGLHQAPPVHQTRVDRTCHSIPSLSLRKEPPPTLIAQVTTVARIMAHSRVQSTPSSSRRDASSANSALSMTMTWLDGSHSPVVRTGAAPGGELVLGQVLPVVPPAAVEAAHDAQVGQVDGIAAAGLRLQPGDGLDAVQPGVAAMQGGVERRRVPFRGTVSMLSRRR